MPPFVFLDTNRLVHDWRLEKPSGEVLLEGAERLGYRLRVPRIVVDEAVNKYRSELESVSRQTREYLERFATMTGHSFQKPFGEVDIETEVDRYEQQLVHRIVQRRHGEIPDYPDTPHSAIAEAAIRGNHLFGRSSGYRDALIWETIKDELEPGSEGILVSSDNAFFGDDGSLPSGLAEDLASELPECSLKPYRTLSRFNGDYLNEDLERLDRVQRDLRRGEGRAGVLRSELEQSIRYRLDTFDLDRERGMPRSWSRIEQKDISKIRISRIEDVRRLDEDTLLLHSQFTAEVLLHFAEEIQGPRSEPRFKDRAEYVPLDLSVSCTFDPETFDLDSHEIREVEATEPPTLQ